MYERIMVPLDGSNAAEMVLPYAEEIATRFNSELALFSVAEPAPAESDHLYRTYLKTIQEKVKAELSEWGTRPGTRVDVEVLSGKPAEEILTYAADKNMSLAVMASRGRSGEGPEFNRLSAELAGVEAELRLVSAALDACREEKGAKQLADARRAVDEAKKAADRAHTGDGLDAAREKLEQSRPKRDAQVESMLAGATEYQAAKTRQAALKTSIEKLGARAAKLSAAELIELARYRQEEHSLARQIYGAQRAWWKRGDAVPLYKEADDAYKAYNALAGKAKAYQEANEKLKQARKTLADAGRNREGARNGNGNVERLHRAWISRAVRDGSQGEGCLDPRACGGLLSLRIRSAPAPPRHR